MEMNNPHFLVRITQIYQYNPDNVQLGAVFVNHDAGAHRVIILTSQSKLNIEPRVGQQWKVVKENNYSIRQQEVHTDKYLDVWRFMEPTLKCVMPDHSSGFVNFLSTEKAFVGIGTVKAQLLWDRFRSDLFSMLKSKKEAVYQPDKSISNFDAIKDVLRRDHTVHALYEGFKEYANLHHSDQLVEWGVEVSIQRQLFRMADQDALEFLSSNPYRLFSLGMSFEKVDVIAQRHFGIKESDEVRLAAIVECALRLWGERGNTLAEWEDLQPIMKRYLNNDYRLTVKANKLDGDTLGFVKQNGKYFASGNYIFERTVARRLSKLSKRKRHWSGELADAFTKALQRGWHLEDTQERAVRTALISDVFALTGGAGTGKTTITKLIVDAYRELGFTIYPVALSGKAARRLKQLIGIDTKTIARLLCETDIKDTNSILLIDEASMLDAYTMWRLVTLFSDTTKIILIGDPYQLPPINAGFILNDVVKSNVINHVELDVVKRQAAHSSIPAYSSLIRQGVMPPSLSTAEIVFQESSEDILQDAVDAYSKYEKAIIVAPTNATVRSVNIKLQSEANATGMPLDLTDMPITEGSYQFRVGDPIVFTLTCYRNDIQNGTLGVIKEAAPNDDYVCVIELEDLNEYGKSRIIKVDWQLFEYIHLAYCLTLHKLQGSQASNVIILLERGILLDRSWLYTAITRSENKVLIIGKESDYRYGVSRPGAYDTRKTGLAGMLKELTI